MVESMKLIATQPNKIADRSGAIDARNRSVNRLKNGPSYQPRDAWVSQDHCACARSHLGQCFQDGQVVWVVEHLRQLLQRHQHHCL